MIHSSPRVQISPQFALIPLGLTLALAACSAPNQAPDPATTTATTTADPAARKAEIASRITWTPLEPAPLQTLITIPAEVVAAPNRTAALMPPLAGRLGQWQVKVGDAVDVGTPLVSVQSLTLTDLAATQTQLTTVLRSRRQGLALARKQRDAGFGTSDSVQQRRMAVAEARARLQEVRQRQTARRALLDTAADANGHTWVWQSPMGGVITQMRCAAGTQVRPDMKCISISDQEGAVVRVLIPQRLLAALGDARPQLAFHQEGSPKARTLNWVRQSPEIDAPSRSRAMFFDAPGLLPGASGRGDLVAPAAQGVFSVPRQALTRLDGQDVVFMNLDDTPTPQPVNVIGRHGRLALVQGDTVAAGALVATTGVFLLKSIHLLEAPL